MARLTAMLFVLVLLAIPRAVEGQPAADESEVEELTKLPQLVELVKAEYPARAQLEGVESVVVLEIDIAADGKVEAVRVAEASQAEGYGFEEAALVAASKFVFEPAEAGGKPVPVRITYRYGFMLHIADDGVDVPDVAPEGTPADLQGGDPPVQNFRGRILERGTRQPLSGVLVTLFVGGETEASGYEALTDEAGEFSFVDVASGRWKVFVDVSGYYPFRTTEEVLAGEGISVVYYLEKGSYNPLDVLVEGERPRKEVTRRTLKMSEVERMPGNYGDPIKVVRNLPGVARPYFGSPAIIVRGSSPEDTRVYVDGVLVPLIYHFGGLRSIIPLGMIETIEFMPGNFSGYYGQSIGGVLDVELKKTAPDAAHGYVDVNVFDAGLFAETPLPGDAFVAVGARRSYIDSVLTYAVPDDAPVNVMTAPRYYDAQLLASWRPTPATQLRLFTFLSDDHVELLFENPKNLDPQLNSGSLEADTSYFRVMVDHSWTPTDDLSTLSRVAVGRDTIEASLGDQFTAEFDLLQLSWRALVTLKMGSRTKLTMGSDATLGLLDVRLLAPQPRKEGDPERFANRDLEDTLFVQEDDLLLGGAAAFAELELEAIDDFLFIPGVRFEQIEPIDQRVVDPRLSLRYVGIEHWVLKGAVGLYHQPPMPDETAEGFGNPDLRAEEAVHYALGAVYRPLDYLNIDLTLFYKDLREMVSRTGATVEDEGELQLLYYNNEGRGRVYGLELLIKHELAHNLFGWITYTLSRAERLDYDATEYRLFDYDQTHILTLIGSYELPLHWTFSLAWRLTSGNPMTPVIGSVYDSGADEYRQVHGEANSARLPTFHQLDVRLDKSWVYDLWKLDLYLDVQNVYNQTNTNFYQYNFDFSQRRPQIGLPVLPVLGAKAEF